MSGGSLAGRVMQGAVMMLLLRWVTRFLGLISIAITARLLTPEDFGVVGSASLIVGFLISLKTAGMGESLIRAKTLEAGHIHTVWTLRLLISFPLLAVLLAFAEVFAVWVKEPRVVPILQLLAFIPLIEALASPAPNLLVRDMDFKRLFYLRVWAKFGGVVATIVLAFVLRDYWALVWGQVAAAFALVAVSHYFYPYLPRLSLSHLKLDGAFTFWSFWRNLAIHIADSVDELVVRQISSTEKFSYYHASRDLARISITEFVAQAGSPLFSAYARLQGDRERLTAAVTSSLGASTILLFATGVMISFSAESLVRLILGQQWLEAAPILEYIALGTAVQALAQMNRGVYAILDKQHLSVAVWSLRALALGVACLAAATTGEMLWVAKAYFVTNAVLSFFDLWLTFHLLGARYPLAKLYLGALTGGVAMAAVLVLVPASLQAWPILDLAVKGVVGSVAFALAVYALWRLRGRPTGPERALLERLPERFRTMLGVA